MKKIITILLSVVTILSFSGCTDKKTTTETTSAPSAETKTEDSSNSTSSKIEEIKKAGKIVLLTEATFPPFEYLKDNDYAGIDIDIANVIAEKLGVKLEIIDMNFDLLPQALTSDKGDFVAAGFTVKDELKNVVDYTTPYVDTSLWIVLPGDSTVATIDDLKDKKVAVQEGTTGDYFATDNIKTDDSNILRFKSAVEAGNSVLSGKADAVVLDKLPAGIVVENSGGKAKILEGFDEPEVMAMLVNKGNEDLVEFINEVIKELTESGEIQKFIDYNTVESTK